MSPIQQMLLGVGAVATKTYVDDVFSTFLYTGTGSSQSINNGIDASGEGAMTWIKMRTQSSKDHQLFDTVRGAGKYLVSNDTDTEGNDTSKLSSFNSNGFTVDSDQLVNQNNEDFSSWTFRKAPGFFDVVTYTGTGSTRTVAHSLGSLPGFIIIKCRSDADQWECFHSALGVTERIRLSENGAAFTDGGSAWGGTAPTSTHFTVNSNNGVNGNGRTYVAYVFAGGESTNALARSVDFDGDDHLSLGTYSDLGAGTDDFTFEAWIKPDAWPSSGAIYPRILGSDNISLNIGRTNSNFIVQASAYNYISTTTFPEIGQWTHVAVTKQYVSSSNQSYIRLFFNGNLIKTYQDTGTINWPTANNTGIGCEPGGDSQYYFDGKISNLRIVKGTAVYTSSFRPPTEPLTNITNTKLLCCNNSSTTGSTVTPGTITANGNPTASTDSPFDDPAAFTFGESGSESVIKTGSYVGNGSSSGPDVFLGFEPSWVMVKNTDASGKWMMVDNMRGAVTGGDDPYLDAADSAAEYTTYNWIEFTPTGFKLTNTGVSLNASGNKYVYLCIRRPDGYVGKPPELGTSVFAMDTGNSSNTEAFTSGFPVDMGIYREPASTSIWYATYRFTENKTLKLNTTAAEASDSELDMDNNTGFANWNGFDSDYQAWMWKRHAGFDVVAFQGTNQNNLKVRHSLNAVPEMIWLKNREASEYWPVYHKGLNGGTNPEQYFLRLNTNAAETDYNEIWNDTAPTAVDFTVGIQGASNGADMGMIAMLFASVDGISKVGSYTGTSATSFTITTGFQPRFVIIKKTNAVGHWVTFDTLRGWVTNGLNTADDQILYMNLTEAQTETDFGTITSDGFVITDNSNAWFANNDKYIYYAHA